MPLKAGPCADFHEPVEQPAAQKTITSALVALTANKNFLVVPIIVGDFQTALPLMCCVSSSDRLDPPW